MVRATRQKRSLGLSMGLPVSSFSRYRFSRTVIALGESRTASPGVDDFMKLPAWKKIDLRGPAFQPNRKAKLGTPINQHNSTESAHDYARSARTHHKYKG